MAHNLKLSDAAANAAANAVVALLSGGSYNIYDGTQPATADTAISGPNLLAVVTLGSPSHGAASAGVCTGTSTTQDSDNNASGTATWFRAKGSGGATVFDGSVGTSGADCNLDNTSVVIHGTLAITSHSYTHPKS